MKNFLTLFLCLFLLVPFSFSFPIEKEYKKIIDCNETLLIKECEMNIHYVRLNEEVMFVINSEEKLDYNLYVYNSLGQLLVNEKIDHPKFFCKEIPQGIYFFKITKNEKFYNKKIILD